MNDPARDCAHPTQPGAAPPTPESRPPPASTASSPHVYFRLAVRLPFPPTPTVDESGHDLDARRACAPTACPLCKRRASGVVLCVNGRSGNNGVQFVYRRVQVGDRSLHTRVRRRSGWMTDR